MVEAWVEYLEMSGGEAWRREESGKDKAIAFSCGSTVT